MVVQPLQETLPGLMGLERQAEVRGKGYVPTPEALVDAMVGKLFADRHPASSDRVLDPGCGPGAFIHGLVRWSRRNRVSLPEITGVEVDQELASHAEQAFSSFGSVLVQRRSFLESSQANYDFVIGNPPYVSITGLGDHEKAYYRGRYQSAKGRFDLYILFFEEAIRQLKPGGRLVFITPEKYLYVASAAPLRILMREHTIEEIELVDEEAFEGLVTYPAITTLTKRSSHGPTKVVLRDGTERFISLPDGKSSWQPSIMGHTPSDVHAETLSDICSRVSCGVATGADSVFVRPEDYVHPGLKPFAYPTIAGRELGRSGGEIETKNVMLIPYDRSGSLLALGQLGELAADLSDTQTRARLESRTCVRRKPWYAFHETPPMFDLLKPKLLCKDISKTPRFWLDSTGRIVPRHSVYYVVPKQGQDIYDLERYLNSKPVQAWLLGHCQRAANGFIRLQSTVLKQLPLDLT